MNFATPWCNSRHSQLPTAPAAFSAWIVHVEEMQPLAEVKLAMSWAITSESWEAGDGWSMGLHLLLVVRPGAPSSVLALSSDARSP